MRLILRPFFLALVLAGCGANPGAIEVIDGDTIDYRGERVRLMGFDTPETWRPECAAERALGEQATARVEQLIANANRVQVVIEDRNDTDRWGRLLGRLVVDGRDVGDILIAEGLAVAYDGGRRDSWCDRLAA